MLIKIQDFTTIADVQEKFSESFPMLKIEFYDVRHKWQQATSLSHHYTNDRNIGSVRNIHNAGIMEIKSWDKVGEVENKFKSQFGLNIQVFHKQGNIWTQTTKTDNCTLQEISDKAKASVQTTGQFNPYARDEVYYEDYEA